MEQGPGVAPPASTGIRAADFREPEVAQLRCTVSCDKYVVCLNISMNDIILVQVGEGISKGHDLYAERECHWTQFESLEDSRMASSQHLESASGSRATSRYPRRERSGKCRPRLPTVRQNQAGIRV